LYLVNNDDFLIGILHRIFGERSNLNCHGFPGSHPVGDQIRLAIFWTIICLRYALAELLCT